MTTEAIATKLADYCKKGEYAKAQQELYGEDVVSIEPEETPMFDKETKGLSAVQEKMNKWLSSVEKEYSVDVSKPLVAGNSFCFTMDLDIKMKGMDRTQMKELCVYTVKDGKVISEEFFW